MHGPPGPPNVHRQARQAVCVCMQAMSVPCTVGGRVVVGEGGWVCRCVVGNSPKHLQPNKPSVKSIQVAWKVCVGSGEVGRR